MQGRNQFPNLLLNIISRAVTAALAIAFLAALTLVLSQSAQTQTGVIYNFTGAVDGAYPSAGLTSDGAGNLYGTTCGQVCGSGTNSYGSVFQLTKHGSSWVFTPLYNFQGGADGSAPISRVMIGPGGVLYGTTLDGGTDGGCYFWLSTGGCGTVFKLRVCASIVLRVSRSKYRFLFWREDHKGRGCFPDDTFTNWEGGTLFKLDASDGWNFSLLYHFPDSNTSWESPAGPWTSLTVTDGTSGEKNFYGTTVADGTYGSGSIFSWTYSNGWWQYSSLWNFGGVQNDGAYPISGLQFGVNDGYAYVTTQGGGTHGMGTVFRIMP